MLIVKFPPTRRGKPPEYVPPAATQTVSVVSVRVIDGTAVVWTFSGPVAFVENVPCPPLRIFVEGQWLGAINVGAWDSPEQIACDYETSELADGLAWAITQSPSGLDFSPATLTLPQSGVLLPANETTRR